MLAKPGLFSGRAPLSPSRSLNSGSDYRHARPEQPVNDALSNSWSGGGFSSTLNECSHSWANGTALTPYLCGRLRPGQFARATRQGQYRPFPLNGEEIFQTSSHILSYWYMDKVAKIQTFLKVSFIKSQRHISERYTLGTQLCTQYTPTRA